MLIFIRLIGLLRTHVLQVENNISFTAGGKEFSFPAPFTFSDFQNEDLVAAAVFGAVANERNRKLFMNEIQTEPTSEEKLHMTMEEIEMWKYTTNIVMVDYTSNKKLTMPLMSSLDDNTYKVESID